MRRKSRLNDFHKFADEIEATITTETAELDAIHDQLNASNHDPDKWAELSQEARRLHRRLQEFRKYDFSMGGMAWEQAEAGDPDWGDYL